MVLTTTDRLTGSPTTATNSSKGHSISNSVRAAVNKSTADQDRSNRNRFSIYMCESREANTEARIESIEEPCWTTTESMKENYETFNNRVLSNLTWSSKRVDNALQLVLGKEYNDLTSSDIPVDDNQIWNLDTEKDARRDRARRLLADRQLQWSDSGRMIHALPICDVFDHQADDKDLSMSVSVSSVDEVDHNRRHVPDVNLGLAREEPREFVKRLARPVMTDQWKSQSDRFHVNLPEFLARRRINEMTRTTSSNGSDCPDLTPDDNESMSIRSITPDLPYPTSPSLARRDQAQVAELAFSSAGTKSLHSLTQTSSSGHCYYFPYISEYSGLGMAHYNLYDASSLFDPTSRAFTLGKKPDQVHHEFQEMLPRKATLADFLKF